MLYLLFANRELKLMTMKKHNGMRPQDIVVLLKIIALKTDTWRNIDIANGLHISQSEVSEALNRCRIARLIDNKKRTVFKNALSEFLIFGLKYVFPTEPGAIVRGVPTAHSASPIKELILSDDKDVYVWPYAKGTARGQAIEPLYQTLPEAVQEDKLLYDLIAIVDTFRVGRVREINIAVAELEKRMEHV